MGESIPVIKNLIKLEDNTPLHLRNNMIYSGTDIVYGKYQIVVFEIGINIEFGNIVQS